MTRGKAVVASYMGVLAYAGFIFLAAGKFRYRQGIIYVITALAGATLTHALERGNSNLSVDRVTMAGAGQLWDKRILGTLFLASLITFVVAGLDSGRFGWSEPMPAWMTIAGVSLMVGGQCLFAVSRRVNRYFSSTVRIQSGHAVCDQGPYRFIRHPGYLGMLISILAFPLLINSYWAFIPASVAAILLIVRTVWEDNVLADALPEYKGYALRTRWKLVPGIL